MKHSLPPLCCREVEKGGLKLVGCLAKISPQDIITSFQRHKFPQTKMFATTLTVMTQFCGTVFHALAQGVVRFVPSGRPRNLFLTLTGGNSHTASHNIPFTCFKSYQYGQNGSDHMKGHENSCQKVFIFLFVATFS